MEDLVLKYEAAASDWADELQVPLTERISMFVEIFVDYASQANFDLHAEDLAIAKFLYCNFLIPDSSMSFVSEIEKAKTPFQMSFGRMELLKQFFAISAPDAKFIVQGLQKEPLLRLVAMSLVTEFTRKSRLTRGIELGTPINLGSFNLLMAALEPRNKELRIHELWTGKSLSLEDIQISVVCQMGQCGAQADWLVICPHQDGREYICSEHKRQQDLDFSTFRLMFTNSCGHYAEKRDCKFVMVGL